MITCAILLLHAGAARADEPKTAIPADGGSASPLSTLEKPWFVDVYEKARASIVRVETGSSIGTGFVFHSPRHIATAFHVIATGRPVRVRFLGGRVLPAEVVAIDSRHDLAILEIAEPACPSPLIPSSESMAIGLPVMTIGHAIASGGVSWTDETLFNWSLSHGVVLRHAPDYVQIDAAVQVGNSGGPVIGRNGQVIGVIVGTLNERFNLFKPTSWLDALTRQIGHQGTFRGQLTHAFEGGLQTQISSGDFLLGVEGGVRLVLHDRWTAFARIGTLFSVDVADPPSPVVSRRITRYAGNLSLGHRWLPSSRYVLYTGLAAGVDFSADQTHDTQAVVNWANDNSPPQVSTQRAASWKGAIRPLMELNAASGPVGVSYAFLLDAKAPTLSVHRVSLGWFF